MKKIAALVMAMLMVTCLFAGCAKKEAANDDLSYVKDKGTLVIGITEYAPMNYYEGDTLVGFDTELAVEFFYAFARDAKLTLHVRELAGGNSHHIIEAAFKAVGRTMRHACELDPRVQGIPSTKGSL